MNTNHQEFVALANATETATQDAIRVLEASELLLCGGGMAVGNLS